MVETSNPFSDPEFKKMLLEEEGKEVISAPMKDLVSSAPSIPSKAKNMILDASAISSSVNSQKAFEMTNALNNVFTKYNQEYGTDLSIDFSSLSNTLINVSDPSKRQVLELYVSEVFKSIRPILLLHLIQKLSLALDYVLDPARMFSGELSLPDMFLVIEKLNSYIISLNDYLPEVTIAGSDQILKKLAEENRNEEINSPESKKAVDDFMSLLRRDIGLSD